MSSEVIIYDEDIYEVTNMERGAVENVVWDSNKYIAYVQWSNGNEAIYAYNVNKTQWEAFVDRVKRLNSVGSALRGTGWGTSFTHYAGWDTEYKAREPQVQDTPSDRSKFEVTINFTGSIVVKVDADTLQDAINAASGMFDNESTTGHVEILEAKKVN